MTTFDRSISTTFEADSARSVGDFLAALNDAFAQLNLDPSNSVRAASSLRINKTLAWKLWKMLESREVHDVLSMLPGPSGMNLLIAKFEIAGVSEPTLAQLGAASDAIREAVKVHVSDRATLELVLDGMERRGNERLELSRQLLYRGASGMLGVQGKLRLAAGFILPNAESDEWLDTGMIAGFGDFRRLRSDQSWSLYTVRDHRPADDSLPQRQPIAGATELGLLPHVGSDAPPAFELQSTKHGTEYVLEPGPLGNAGAVNMYFGHVMRRSLYAFARDNDRTNEFAAKLTAPFERLVADFFVHRSLELWQSVEAIVLGEVRESNTEVSSMEQIAPRVPIDPTITHMPGSVSSIGIPAYPAYSAAIERMYDTLGMDGNEFRVLRVSVDHPPIGSTVITRFAMPDPPHGSGSPDLRG